MTIGVRSVVDCIMFLTLLSVKLVGYLGRTLCSITVPLRKGVSPLGDLSLEML